MTEASNDHTLPGRPNLYAADQNSHLPSYQLQTATDPFSQPSLSTQYGHQPAASALVQHQVQLPLYNNIHQTNVLSANSPPQNHKTTHLIYQHQPAMPMPVYNPTYLVTQSNQLLNQHKQHLFKPDPVFLQQSQKPAFAQESEFLPSYQLQQSVVEEQSVPVIQHQNHQISQPLDEPQFARLIAAPQQQPQQNQQQSLVRHNQQAASRPSLTENEMLNLLNFGRIEGAANDLNKSNQQAGFVASSYFQTGPKESSTGSLSHSSPTLEDVYHRHQQHNEERIVEATRQAIVDQKQHKHQKSPQDTIFVTKSPEQKQQEESESSLHIYVPDQLEYAGEHVIER